MHVLSGGGISIVAQNDDSNKNLLCFFVNSRITLFHYLFILPYIFRCALLQIVPVVKDSSDTPYSSTRHVEFVRNDYSPFGNVDM
jgi:hypothetical protein